MTAPVLLGFRPLGRRFSGAPYPLCPTQSEGLWNGPPNASLNSLQRDVEYRWAGVLNRFVPVAVLNLRWPFAATTYSDRGGNPHPAAPTVRSAMNATPARQHQPLAEPESHTIALTLNGKQLQLAVEPWTTLLDLLRDHLDLTGTKKGCDHGQCGACTVLVNGTRINSCLALAVMQDGAEVTTIEGLAQGDQLHPMQEAFVAEDAFQCGYCTPGQICSAIGMLKEGHAHSEAEVAEQMSGNLCRCGAYRNIRAAIERARPECQQGEGRE